MQAKQPNSIIIDTKKLPVCYTEGLSIEPGIQNKSNVFVGIGLWSKVHGLSIGLPIDFLGMLITADVVRKQLGNGFIYIYIADYLALESLADHQEITANQIYEQRDKTIVIIKQICQWLQLENVVIEDSRTLPQSTEWEKVTQEIETKFGSIKKSIEVALEPTQENYVLKQTALIKHYYDKKNCGVKISWSIDDPKEIQGTLNEIIKNGSDRHYDELWFDVFYRLILGKNDQIGFVYTQSGAPIDGNHFRSPYFANQSQVAFPRILFNDEASDIRQKLPKNQSNARNQQNQGNPDNFRFHPAFKTRMLNIFQALKENYPHISTYIQSKKNESKTSPIFYDLLTIASFSKKYVKIENNDYKKIEQSIGNKPPKQPNQYVFFPINSKLEESSLLLEQKSVIYLKEDPVIYSGTKTNGCMW